MEWKEYSLGDISKLKYGKNVSAKLCKGPVPIFSGYRKIGTCNTINCKKNTVIVIARGAGGCGDVKLTKEDCFLTNLSISVELDKGICNAKWFYYNHLLNNLSFLNSGSAQPQITIDSLSKYLIRIPPIIIQRKIAGILSALDSKIENNNKINANLEAQAEALFKSWFVDFTPFKDQPFVDSELGPIPQGWKVGKLGDICTFKRGKNLLSKNAIDEGVPVVAGGLSPSCYHNQANTSAPVVTVSGSGANAGFMRMYHVDVWASDCSFIDVSCDYLYFVYCFLSVNRRLLKHAQTGAVQPHVKPADIHDFDVVIPEEDIVKAFQSIIKELLTKVGVNEKENQRLAAVRDTLLPKLMSGEIKL